MHGLLIRVLTEHRYLACNALIGCTAITDDIHPCKESNKQRCLSRVAAESMATRYGDSQREIRVPTSSVPPSLVGAKYDSMPFARQALLVSLAGAVLVILLAIAPAMDAIWRPRRPPQVRLEPERKAPYIQPGHKAGSPGDPSISEAQDNSSTMRCAGFKPVERACLVHDLYYDTLNSTFTYYGTKIVADAGSAPVKASAHTFSAATCVLLKHNTVQHTAVQCMLQCNVFLLSKCWPARHDCAVRTPGACGVCTNTSCRGERSSELSGIVLCAFSLARWPVPTDTQHRETQWCAVNS